jgi:hypothetical protein
MAYALVHGEERTIYFTTKDTKITKFGVLNIRTLRVLRALRAEIGFFHRARQLWTTGPESLRELRKL